MSNWFIDDFLDYYPDLRESFLPAARAEAVNQGRSPQIEALVDFFLEYGEFLQINPDIIRAAVLELEGNDYDISKVKIHFAESFLKEATRTFLDENKSFTPER